MKEFSISMILIVPETENKESITNKFIDWVESNNYTTAGSIKKIYRNKLCTESKNGSSVEYYSLETLIEFGNYLLSQERKDRLNNDERVINSVNDTDLDYFFNK